jgi:hypothetical protein
VGVLGRVYRLFGDGVRVELGRFADGFEENLMRELVGIARASFGAVKHNASSMARREPKSMSGNFKLTHYQSNCATDSQPARPMYQ